MRILTRGLLFGIRIYRLFSMSAMARCRFYPTCSAYALEALERQGLWKGAAKAAARLLRCHPWHSGGYDPVV